MFQRLTLRKIYILLNHPSDVQHHAMYVVTTTEEFFVLWCNIFRYIFNIYQCLRWKGNAIFLKGREMQEVYKMIKGMFFWLFVTSGVLRSAHLNSKDGCEEDRTVTEILRFISVDFHNCRRDYFSVEMFVLWWSYKWYKTNLKTCCCLQNS